MPLPDGWRVAADQDAPIVRPGDGLDRFVGEVDALLGVNRRALRRTTLEEPGTVTLDERDFDATALVAEVLELAPEDELGLAGMRTMLGLGGSTSRMTVGLAYVKHLLGDDAALAGDVVARYREHDHHQGIRSARRRSSLGERGALLVVRFRAAEAGVPVAELLASMRGTRNARFAAHKRLRRKLIRDLRELGCTQEIIARVFGVTQARVSQLEKSCLDD